MRINRKEISLKARWSLRLALFMAQLLIVTVLLHRFFSLPTLAATNLVVIGLIGAAAAALLAIIALVNIWNRGMGGTASAIAALVVCMMIFAIPLYYLPALISLPAINDISTDLLSPPQYNAIAALREADANDPAYPGRNFISAQAKAYPDITTLRLKRPVADSFDLAHEVAKSLGWDIVFEHSPDRKNPVGYIEAIDHSLLFGSREDIVVRISGNSHSSRIDMRSSSRYGRHDLGSNAARIRKTFSAIKNRIAREEARRIDDIERRRIALQMKALQRKRELERKKREQKRKQEEANAILPKANFGQLGPEEEGVDGMGGMNGQLSMAGKAIGKAMGAGPNSARPTGFGDFQTYQNLNRRPRKARKNKPRRIHRSRRRRHHKSWKPFFDLP